MAAVRFFVHDVDQALTFYVDLLGFELSDRWGPAFAIVKYDGLSVWLSGPGTSAMKPMSDGSQPGPGGWNRLVVQVGDLEAKVAGLLSNGIAFRNEILSGPGGSQVLVEDGQGNVVELFESRD